MKRRNLKTRILGYVKASFAVGLTTATIAIIHTDKSIANVAMLYLLTVQIIALFCGSRPAVFASVLAFLAFDWFYLSPRYQFSVQDPSDLVALFVFLATAITVGHLTALFHYRAEEAKRREAAATALAESSCTVASELDTKIALKSVIQHLSKLSSLRMAAILLRETDDTEFELLATCLPPGLNGHASRISKAAIAYVSQNREAIGWDGDYQWDSAFGLPAIYIPVITHETCMAVFFVELCDTTSAPNESDRQIIDSITNLIAVVLQRASLVKKQARAEALEETNKLKTALLQMVSHDFKSPLASIKASVGSLQDDEDNSLDAQTRSDLLRAIESETDRLNKMIGNILDLSRLESGNWIPLSEPTGVADLIGTTLDSFTASQNKRIKVTFDRVPEEIVVDPVQIVQVLRNLVENALKYSGPDSIVEIDVLSEHDDFIVRVKDRGLGLPKGEENRIFDPFYRAPAYCETAIPGTGMGLAIARGLLEAHAAKLTAKSREGGGAIFEAVFPGMSARKAGTKV